MFSIEDLRLIRAIASSTSLAAAARLLDVTPGAVTQRLAAIEGRLGVRLVHRGRKTALTSDGRAVAERAAGILEEIDALESSVAGSRGELRGQIRVAAPFGFGREYIAPLVASFRALHPRVKIDLQLSETLSPEQTRGVDVSIHVGELRDAAKVAVRLAPNERFLCAAPSYLERRGVPTKPDDLREHDCIALRENDDDATLWRMYSGERPISVRIAPVLSSNDGEVVRIWALAGMGIIVRSEWSVAADIRAGRLVRVLEQFRAPSADVVALIDSRRGLPPRVRAFIDHARLRLDPPPWRSMQAR